MSGISPYKLASVLLQYPTTELFAGLDRLDDVAADTSPRATRQGFGRFLRWLRGSEPAEVAQHYVDTFDLPAARRPGRSGTAKGRSRCTLYLTYHRYGDTRRRGQAMITFTAAYRSAGMRACTGELPDYLPVVLDLAALHPRGEALLRAHRAELELVHRALTGAGSPYGDVVGAVCAHLPGLTRRDHALVRRLAAAGPPTEEVGLEPFAPPEYLSGPVPASGRAGEPR